MTSTNVQDAITEVFNAAGGTPTAATVSFVPAGGIVATNVQDALTEVGTGKLNISNFTASNIVSTLGSTPVNNATDAVNADRKSVV